MMAEIDKIIHSPVRLRIMSVVVALESEEEIDFTIKLIKEKVAKLRELSPLWDMYKEGIDLNSIQWAAH